MSESKRGSAGSKSPKKRSPRARKEEGTSSPREITRAAAEETRRVPETKPEVRDEVRDTRDNQSERETEAHFEEESNDSYESADHEEHSAPSAPMPERPPENIRVRPSDEYMVQTYFDKQARNYVSCVLEFPDLKTSAKRREIAEEELLLKIDDYLEEVRRKGGSAPEAIQSRSYPDRLDVPVSQSLFKRLDIFSRKEKISLDQLVVELLTAAMERRPEARQGEGQHRHQPHQEPRRQGGGQPHQQHSHGQGGGHRHQDNHNRDRDNRGNQRQHGGGRDRNNNMRGRSYNDTMGNRENFLEYVRNLEKNGGSNWRKK